MVVVDDGSAPAVELPELRPENTSVLRTSESWGRAHACRQGAEFADGDVIHWLDSDMLLHHDEVEAQLRWHHLVDYAVVLGHKLFMDPHRGHAVVQDAFEVRRAPGGPGELFDGRWTAAHDWVEEFVRQARRPARLHVPRLPRARRRERVGHGATSTSPPAAWTPRSSSARTSSSATGSRQRGALFVPDREARSWHLGRSP